MKKSIIFLLLAVSVIACTNETKDKEVKKEVIVVPAAPPAPTPPAKTVIVNNPPEKSTTIKLDKNGVEVGTKKVDISIKP